MSIAACVTPSSFLFSALTTFTPSLSLNLVCEECNIINSHPMMQIKIIILDSSCVMNTTPGNKEKWRTDISTTIECCSTRQRAIGEAHSSQFPLDNKF